MRIAYLVSQYVSGYHHYLQREVRALREMGLEVHVVSIGPPDGPVEGLTPLEREEAVASRNVKSASVGAVLVIHLRTVCSSPLGYLSGLGTAMRLSGWSLRRLLYHLFYFGEAVVAGYWIRAEHLTHFHVHYCSTVGLLVTKVFPLTMSMTLHGQAEFVDPVGFHLAEKVSASTFVCAISHFGKSRILLSSAPSDWNKVEVVHLGVDLEEFTPVGPRESPGPLRIISVGRLVKLKGIPVLMNALAQLLAEGLALRLHLAGEGPERANLQTYAARIGLEGHIEFEGYLNQPELRGLYAQGDLFVLASFDEGLPVVLMEAMAMGLPCVATRITGIPELIRDEVDGLLVDPGDEQSLALAIQRLVDDPELRLRLGRAGRERVREKFNLRRNGAALSEVFRRRLSGDRQ